MAKGMDLKVTSNVKRFERKLSKFGKKQIPFATAGALTATAFDLQRFDRRLYQRAFDVTNKTFPKLMTQVDKAKKTKLRATVGAIRPNAASRAEVLSRHERGGTRRPKRAKRLAVPGRRVGFTATGKIKKSHKIDTLFSAGKAVVLKTSRGNDAIFVKSSSGAPLQLMYFLKRTVTNRRTYHFHKANKREAKRVFGKNMARKLEKALATARYK